MVQPNYTGVNHLAFATKDIDTTIKFWRDLLGMKMVLGFGGSKQKHYFFKISKSDMVSFFQWPEVEPLKPKDHGVPVKGPFGFDHLAIGVKSDDDLWILKDRLEASDIWVSEVIDHGFIHSIYSFDPNEIPIEFSAEVPGIDLDKNPVIKDSAMTPAAKEGPLPQKGKWPEVKQSTKKEDKIVYPGEGKNIIFK